MSKVDIMFTLNKTLQKSRKRPNTWFIWVQYIPLGMLSTLFMDQVNIRLLILQLSNLLF